MKLYSYKLYHFLFLAVKVLRQIKSTKSIIDYTRCTVQYSDDHIYNYKPVLNIYCYKKSSVYISEKLMNYIIIINIILPEVVFFLNLVIPILFHVPIQKPLKRVFN